MSERIIRKPVYTQVKDLLLAKIKSGVYRHGERLPSETELAREFGTSRVTLREALKVLEDDGYITRRHGSGTYLKEQRPARPENGLERLCTIAELVAPRGSSYGAEEILISIEEAQPHEAQKLSLPVGSRLTVISWTSLLDGAKVARSLYVFPDRYGNHQQIIEHLDHSLFDFMEAASGEKISRSIGSVVLSRAGDRLAKRLDIKSSTRVLLLEQVIYSRANLAMVYARDFLSPEKLSIPIIRRR
ncbi:MAG: GntR family transcriptional regulator [Firmicutes bacterium]|nr:GntR family transcriptional regulator [Bacillota bacterium]